jgi:ribonuclease HII
MPDLSLEHAYAPHRVCGVDEAGRGPWAGPVVAAAVMFLNQTAIPSGLNDSKKLSAKARATLAAQLRALPETLIGVGIASVEEIDQLNIWGATQLAMMRAAQALSQKPEAALIDGNRHPKPFPCPTYPVIGGDGRSLSIAAASIIAKTTRDALMEEYALRYPHYGFERHAGYGTAAHHAALAAYGPCPIHRTSFRPIRELMERAA